MLCLGQHSTKMCGCKIIFTRIMIQIKLCHLHTVFLQKLGRAFCREDMVMKDGEYRAKAFPPEKRSSLTLLNHQESRQDIRYLMLLRARQPCKSVGALHAHYPLGACIHSSTSESLSVPGPKLVGCQYSRLSNNSVLLQC